MSDVVWALLLLPIILAALLVLVSISASFGPFCRCGHHRSVHRGRNTECVGLWDGGRNAIGARVWNRCACAQYRPTEVGYWRRCLDGTEEHQWT